MAAAKAKNTTGATSWTGFGQRRHPLYYFLLAPKAWLAIFVPQQLETQSETSPPGDGRKELNPAPPVCKKNKEGRLLLFVSGIGSTATDRRLIVK
jgi:hypothetical protein